ncbi:hypothetical protein ACXHQ9_09165 [Vibrio cincinnatiensis]
MARNPNERLKARHVTYCGGTGSGKTTAIHHLGEIPKTEDVIIFDTYGTFRSLGVRKVYQAFSCADFYNKLVHLRTLKKAFVLALVSKRTQKEFEFFQKCAWDVADGYRPLHIVNEELIRFVNTINKAEGQLGENYQGGRKFGLVCHSIFQRGQEVPKSVLRGSQIFWVGKQDSKADARYWEDIIDVSANELMQLQELEYYLKKHGIGNVKRGKLKPIS